MIKKIILPNLILLVHTTQHKPLALNVKDFKDTDFKLAEPIEDRFPKPFWKNVKRGKRKNNDWS